MVATLLFEVCWQHWGLPLCLRGWSAWVQVWLWLAVRQLQEWVQREWVQRERDQQEWGQHWGLPLCSVGWNAWVQVWLAVRQLQEWVQREWVLRERDQEEWGQQEWVREEAWVRQEASQQSQADPARTHPDQGTVGWPEQVFPVSAVPLRQQPVVPWQATGHLYWGSAPARQRMVWPHTHVCRGRYVRSRRAVQDATGLGSCSCRGHGFSGKPGHQRVVGDRHLSGPSAFVSPLQLLGDASVPWRVKPAGAADDVVPSRWAQPRTWLCAQAGGQLVAAVPGRTEGSGAKTRWKREAYCYTPARAPGGTVATWTSVPGAGFEADHATSDWIARTARCHGDGMEWSGSSWSHRAHTGISPA